MTQQTDSVSLSRWRTARRITLGAILLAGSMATTAAAVSRMATCTRTAQPAEVYSGIGVTISSVNGETVVREVNPEGPAFGKLFPGAHLVSVDGLTPRSPLEWKGYLRGEADTSVQLEVAYPGSCHQRVQLTREIIRVGG